MSTIRQSIVSLLKGREMTARELSQSIGIGEKEIYDHLTHIARSKNLGGTFILLPSQCKKCGYIYKKRERLHPPSRCFLCKGESLTAPRFTIRAHSSPRKEKTPAEG